MVLTPEPFPEQFFTMSKAIKQDADSNLSGH